MTTSRAYRSPVRDAQARLTEQRVLDTAEDLFLSRGYTATSVAQVARGAGVSPQTVYNVFGSKVEVLARLYTRRVLGGDPTPPLERPEIRALDAETDAAWIVRAYVSLSRELAERVGPLETVVAAAAAGDADVAARVGGLGAERLLGAELLVRRLRQLDALRPGLGDDEARDRLWTLSGSAVWRMLTRERGWSTEAYETWLTEVLSQAVLADPDAVAVPPWERGGEAVRQAADATDPRTRTT
ncbi:transcriptional regulator, TetR family [Beutenbergia cavernae DSM 12333]|uniref:Transcriptional regulator, TetR family n=1 Tax=Beutenbergia cavernae (strain ATCC BAA-8 / DSM 12333 / CCUG 43141 / JCM 11478 / NBRC 16432 / NCIMB 13614 / HKI 0122) TaxID=471853 RepID=C5C2F5_BEUC1|nr:helix-turn-helix domain-containing protein [Beutenbergia cavernae]ACQ79641.1 transcriptional regulator, TetR family [Beutenbergia cavernae DSM 12333]